MKGEQYLASFHLCFFVIKKKHRLVGSPCQFVPRLSVLKRTDFHGVRFQHYAFGGHLNFDMSKSYLGVMSVMVNMQDNTL